MLYNDFPIHSGKLSAHVFTIYFKKLRENHLTIPHPNRKTNKCSLSLHFGRLSWRWFSLSIWRMTARISAISDMLRFLHWPQTEVINHWLIEAVGLNFITWLIVRWTWFTYNGGTTISNQAGTTFLLSKIFAPPCPMWLLLFTICKVMFGNSWCVILYQLHFDFDHWLKIHWNLPVMLRSLTCFLFPCSCPLFPQGALKGGRILFWLIPWHCQHQIWDFWPLPVNSSIGVVMIVSWW